MKIMTTKNDLVNWVDEHITDWVSIAEVRAIEDAIVGMPNRPAWGDVWDLFLDKLPDDLTELLAE